MTTITTIEHTMTGCKPCDEYTAGCIEKDIADQGFYHQLQYLAQKCQAPDMEEWYEVGENPEEKCTQRDALTYWVVDLGVRVCSEHLSDAIVMAGLENPFYAPVSVIVLDGIV